MSEQRMVNIAEIKPNADNPRTISEEKFKSLVESIRSFPEMLKLRPIIVDASMTILGGNMRLRALQELGYKQVPIIVADDLTEAQKNEFIIKDNVSFGDWNWDTLANEWDISELESWGLDIPMFLGTQEAQEDDYEMPDDIETDIVRGDLFEIGRHRLMCGDSGNEADMAILMNGSKADIVFTDPPYGVSIGKKNRFLSSMGNPSGNIDDIVDDDLSPDQLFPILTQAFKVLKSNCKDDATYFVTAPTNGEPGLMMMMMMKEAGLTVRHVLIWKKNAPTFSMGRLDYDYQHEPILLTWSKKHNYYGGGKHKTSVWEIEKPRSNKEHPTMKPVALPENAMLNNSKEGDIIVDIYLGSGTTMVAAHQLTRKCYGMEIDPKYCQVIIDRMLQLDPTIEIKRNGQPYKKGIM